MLSCIGGSDAGGEAQSVLLHPSEGVNLSNRECMNM